MAAVERLPAPHYSVDFILLSFGIMVLRCRIDGTTESVMVAYTHKYAKV